MKHFFARWGSVCAALLMWSAGVHADEQHHILWSLQGKTNKVYLLGSMHLLKESEKLPAAIDSAYADADALIQRATGFFMGSRCIVAGYATTLCA